MLTAGVAWAQCFFAWACQGAPPAPWTTVHHREDGAMLRWNATQTRELGFVHVTSSAQDARYTMTVAVPPVYSWRTVPQFISQGFGAVELDIEQHGVVAHAPRAGVRGRGGGQGERGERRAVGRAAGRAEVTTREDFFFDRLIAPRGYRSSLLLTDTFRACRSHAVRHVARHLPRVTARAHARSRSSRARKWAASGA